MLLQDIYSQVALRCGLNDSDTTHKTRILNATNGQLKRIYTNLDLQSERTYANLTTVANTDTYVLDSRVLRAVNFRQTDSPAKLIYKSREDFEREHPNPASTETGVPSIYVPMRKVRVSAQPTSASTISIVSSSASDITSYYVVVRGISSDVMKTERLLLTGTTPVVSTNSYTSLLSISKDTTVGTITATSNAGAVTNISLLPGEKEKEHWEVRLYLIPDDVYTIPYTFQYVPWILSYDEENVCIPDVYIEALLAMITAQVLFELGDAKAPTWRAEANTLLAEVNDQNFMGKDDDTRFGFEEISYPGNFT